MLPPLSLPLRVFALTLLLMPLHTAIAQQTLSSAQTQDYVYVKDAAIPVPPVDPQDYVYTPPQQPAAPVQDYSEITAQCIAYFTNLYTCSLLNNGVSWDGSSDAQTAKNNQDLLTKFAAFGSVRGYTFPQTTKDRIGIMDEQKIYVTQLFNGSRYARPLPGMEGTCSNFGIVADYLAEPCAALLQTANLIVNGTGDPTKAAPPPVACSSEDVANAVFASGTIVSDLANYQKNGQDDTQQYTAGLSIDGALQNCGYQMPNPIPSGQSATYQFTPPTNNNTYITKEGQIVVVNAACPTGTVTVSCQNGQPVISNGGISAYDYLSHQNQDQTSPQDSQQGLNSDGGGGM